MDRRSFNLFSGDSVTGLAGFRGPTAGRDRIVVAGGGIVGSSIAFHLANRGAQVVLLEKSKPSAGATSKSFGWINASYSKQPRAYNDLCLLSMASYHHQEKELGGAMKVEWAGSLNWSADRGYSRRLRSRVQEHQKWGYPIRLVDEGEFRRLEPAVEPGPMLAAAYSEQEGMVDPLETNLVLVEKARQAGAGVEYPCEVTGLDLHSGRLRGVKTTGGDFPADVLVLACGVDTPRLAEKAGIKVPLLESPGLLAHTKPSKRVLQRIVRSPGLEMRQKQNGTIVTGAGYAGPSPRVNEDTHEQGELALERISPFLPGLERMELDRVTLGWRPVPEDGHPILGFAESSPDIYLTVMHSGITLSSIVGRLAAVEILDDVRLDMLQHYRVSRFC